MSLQKLYIDHNLKADFEILCIRDKIITSFRDQDDIPLYEHIYNTTDSPSPHHENYNRKITNKTKLLQYLTIFETIDSSISKYNLSQLIGYGLVDQNSNINTEELLADGYMSDRILGNDSEIVRLSHMASFDLLKNNKNNFISRFLLRYKKRVESQQWYIIDKNKLESEFDIILEKLNYGEYPDSNLEYLNFFAGEVEEELASNYYGVLNSLKSDSIFGYNQRIKFSSTYNPKIEDVYYIAKTRLSDETSFMPYPENFNDVLRFREKKEIQSFRVAMSSWLEVLKEGNEKLEMKMRNDIRKANKEIKKLGKWKKFETSNFNFWFGSVCNWIPVVDKVYSVVQVIGKVNEIKVKNKYGWIQLANT